MKKKEELELPRVFTHPKDFIKFRDTIEEEEMITRNNKLFDKNGVLYAIFIKDPEKANHLIKKEKHED